VVIRSLSYSELSTALTCQARHAFQYTGHLTNGQTLKRRQIARILSDGRAWGAAVASWHAFRDDPTLFGAYSPLIGKMAAHSALRASYELDVIEQLELSVHVSIEDQVERQEQLGAILDHYMATAERMLGLTRIEGELSVPIPSRTGQRPSSRYRFVGLLDGFLPDLVDEKEWLVEFKLRTKLTPVKFIQLSRQIRWYAWARQRETGQPIVGAIIDERLMDAPKPPRLVIARRKGEGINGRVPSHATDQLCTAADYVALCNEYGVYPVEDTVNALEARVWQQRVPILFRPGELDEAGQELVSAAKLIRDLDSGELYPVRNAQPQLCRSCRFVEACPAPDDALYIDTIYERTVPKRLRDQAPVPPDDTQIESSPPTPAAPEGASSRGARGSAAPVNPYLEVA
jgi:hypothetical protein